MVVGIVNSDGVIVDNLPMLINSVGRIRFSRT